jgi:hypothetical protein
MGLFFLKLIESVFLCRDIAAYLRRAKFTQVLGFCEKQISLPES